VAIKRIEFSFSSTAAGLNAEEGREEDEAEEIYEFKFRIIKSIGKMPHLESRVLRKKGI
jgi:hypothetical protein